MLTTPQTVGRTSQTAVRGRLAACSWAYRSHMRPSRGATLGLPRSSCTLALGCRPGQGTGQRGDSGDCDPPHLGPERLAEAGTWALSGCVKRKGGPRAWDPRPNTQLVRSNPLPMPAIWSHADPSGERHGPQEGSSQTPVQRGDPQVTHILVTA